MGRELRRKEEKRKGIKHEKNINIDEPISLSSVLKISFLVILILVVLYYVVAIFITKEMKVSWFRDEVSETNNEVTNRILAKNTFSQKEDSYYVYFYDFNEEDASILNAISSKSLTFYKVDTSSALNSNYVTEGTGNRNATGIDDLLVISPTLVEVSGDRIVSYYEGKNEILNFVK